MESLVLEYLKHNWKSPTAAQSIFELMLALSRTSRAPFKPICFRFMLWSDILFYYYYSNFNLGNVQI